MFKSYIYLYSEFLTFYSSVYNTVDEEGYLEITLNYYITEYYFSVCVRIRGFKGKNENTGTGSQRWMEERRRTTGKRRRN